MNARAFVAVLLPLAILAAGLVAYVQSVRPARAAQPPTELIPAPGQWVAFDATSRKMIKGVVRVVGRYYQSSNGSSRSDTGPSLDDIKVKSIKNIWNSRYYTFDGTGSQPIWTSNPMLLPPDGHQPLQFKANRLNQDLVRLYERIEEFDVLLYRMRGGDRYIAPALNFFALRTESADTIQEFVEVRLREQPRELFFPPPDVKVEERSEPLGIVSTAAAKAAGIELEAHSPGAVKHEH